MFIYGSNCVYGNTIRGNSLEGLFVAGCNLPVISNVIDDNGGNGILNFGANAVTLNMGSGNNLFGIILAIPGLVAGNFVDGDIASEMPPLAMFNKLSELGLAVGVEQLLSEIGNQLFSLI